MTQEQSNKNLMLTVFAAMKDGHLEPLFEALSPGVIWKATAPQQYFRFGGVHRGLAGMKEYTALLSSRYHFIRLEPRAITAKDDHVWALFEAEALHLPSNRYVRFDLFIHWTMRNGKIAEHQSLFDTADVLIQQGELGVDAA
jgi:ketosteroid isomerase-like protein